MDPLLPEPYEKSPQQAEKLSLPTPVVKSGRTSYAQTARWHGVYSDLALAAAAEAHWAEMERAADLAIANMRTPEQRAAYRDRLRPIFERLS